MGWKAPPKPQAKEPPRQPTETQAAAAKRLSQGLSVNLGGRQRNANNLSSASFSVVLDSQEASNNLGPYDNGFTQQLPLQETASFPNTGSTKASRWEWIHLLSAVHQSHSITLCAGCWKSAT